MQIKQVAAGGKCLRFRLHRIPLIQTYLLSYEISIMRHAIVRVYAANKFK